MNPSFPDMHDWSLLAIEFNWTAGQIELRLKSPEGGKVLTATEAASLQISRERPWGPSVSVNACNLQSSEQGRQTLTLQMQSGDTIAIQAATFALQ